MTAVRLPVRQGTSEWLDARRALISSTDISVIVGVSPYKSEATLAAEKRGEVSPPPPNAAMRLGSAMEGFVATEYSTLTGRKVRRVRNLLQHPTIDWAVASLDREVVGERRLVEVKTTTSRRWEDGLPQEVESQVRWALGVTGYPVADVAVWHFGGKEPLEVIEVGHDPDLFAALVALATDFRRRLAEGGPFTEDLDSLRARYPRDDGSEIEADPDVAEAVRALLAVRASIGELEANEERLKVAIQARMGDAAAMRGEGFHVIWRRTKDRIETDWRAVSDAALARLPEPERAALVGKFSTVKDGFRPFRVVKED